MFLTCDADRWTDRIQNGSSKELRGCGVTATVAVAVAAAASGVGIITASSEHFDNGRIVLEYVYRTYTILYTIRVQYRSMNHRHGGCCAVSSRTTVQPSITPHFTSGGRPINLLLLSGNNIRNERFGRMPLTLDSATSETCASTTPRKL